MLTPDGIVICKIMDSRFRGSLVRNHDIVATAFEDNGFALRDQIVYIRTVTGSNVNNRSAQSTHGYFLVLERKAQRRLVEDHGVILADYDAQCQQQLDTPKRKRRA